MTSEASHQGGATTQSDSCISKPQTASPSQGGKSCIAKLLLMGYGDHAVNTFIYGDVKVICEDEKNVADPIMFPFVLFLVNEPPVLPQVILSYTVTQ